MKRRQALLLTAALTTLGACAPAAQEPSRSASPAVASSPEAWLTTLDRAHPLVGQLWDVRAGALVTPETVARRLASARFVLVGERHDNPDHHRLQARALQWLVEAGRKPVVAFEMLEVEQQPLLDELRKRPGLQAGELGTALGWEKTTWPPYAEYQPIFEVALSAGLRLVAANLAHQDAKALVKQGASALAPERVSALQLGAPFPDPLQQALLGELRSSHCGHLPESLLEPMALAQHARDAQMASVMVQAGGSEGALLIAGSGHVRKDRGVPYYLNLQAPGATLLSVAMQEVDSARRDARDYQEPDPQASVFDYLWFTPRLSDDDPCAAFKTK
ncbi:MAG TPA: ChaN family lipoprotein [Polyangiaceae bacterium]